MNILNPFKVLSIATLLFACNSSSVENEGLETNNLASETAQSTEVNIEVTKLMESIPSPLEFSAIILGTNAKYTEAFLNTIENVKNYNSDYKKAANLGVFGADLGYINLYGKTYSAIDYLNTVYHLSADLRIEKFFDFETVKRLATNNQNIDSITHITTLGFEKMNDELEKDQKGNISALILIGGWIEGVHLTCEIAKASKENQKLLEAIYDENIVIGDLVKITEHYKNQPLFDGIHSSLKELQETYLTIAKTSTDLNEEQFNQISSGVEKVRNVIIK